MITGYHIGMISLWRVQKFGSNKTEFFSTFFLVSEFHQLILTRPSLKAHKIVSFKCFKDCPAASCDLQNYVPKWFTVLFLLPIWRPLGLPLCRSTHSQTLCPEEKSVRESGVALYLCLRFFLLPAGRDTFLSLLSSDGLSSSVSTNRKGGL